VLCYPPFPHTPAFPWIQTYPLFFSLIAPFWVLPLGYIDDFSQLVFIIYMGPAPLELFMVHNIFLTYSP
jgi:hypothetical protein